MANPSTFSGYAGLGLLVSASTASQDLAANTSTLNVNLYLTGMYAGSYSASSYSNYTVQQPTGSVFASGDSGAYSITNTQSVLIYSGTRVVTHDANGDITTTLTGYDDTFNGTATATMSYTPASTARVPTATTQAVSAVATTTATGNGNITWGGNNPISERGICYGTSANPTTANDKDTAAGTTGAFTTSITALTPNTLYHARAYAINGKGTSYGADVTFTTLPSMGVFTDPAKVYGAGYATCAADSGIVALSISKDGGTNWSVAKPLTLTTGAGDTILTYGSTTDNWGIPLTGANIKHATNFLVRITCGTSIQFQNSYKAFDFSALADGVTVFGITATVVAKYVAATPLVSVDSLTVVATTAGTSDNILEGSTTYDSTLNTLTAFDGTNWLPMSPWINPYKFRVYRDAAYTSIADATLTVVDFDAESFDTDSNFDLTTDKYTIPVTGYYNLSFSVRASGTAMIALSAYIYGGAAGNTVLVSTYAAQASTTDGYVCVSGLFYCVKDDLINARIYADTTGTYAILAGTESTYFSGFLVSI